MTPPLFPTVVDYRTARFQCNAVADGDCPHGETLWSSTPFRVSNAKGGAILANGPNHVRVRDTEFRANEADRGASKASRHSRRPPTSLPVRAKLSIAARVGSAHVRHDG